MKYMIIKLDEKPSLDVNNEESAKENTKQEEN